MKWDYPVFAPEAGQAGEGTTSRKARKAMTREEAIAYIAGDDPRPLLILRECKVCNGTDEALLKGGIDNEKTFLLSAWYHCVKVPVDVMEENHPFHNIFVQDKTPEHLFVCSIDGTNHDPLESQTSRRELWKSMVSLLEKEYETKPKKPLKAIAKLLDKLDEADGRVQVLCLKRDDILENDGPSSKKLPKISLKLEAEEHDLAVLKSKVQEAYRNELRRQKMAAKDKEKATASR
ncbi:MAG: hypothetical protein ACI9F9_000414 [Candidatus Paceibacteria bacterium]|jgi:hypothetical protein